MHIHFSGFLSNLKLNTELGGSCMMHDRCLVSYESELLYSECMNTNSAYKSVESFDMMKWWRWGEKQKLQKRMKKQHKANAIPPKRQLATNRTLWLAIGLAWLLFKTAILKHLKKNVYKHLLLQFSPFKFDASKFDRQQNKQGNGRRKSFWKTNWDSFKSYHMFKKPNKR